MKKNNKTMDVYMGALFLKVTENTKLFSVTFKRVAITHFGVFSVFHLRNGVQIITFITWVRLGVAAVATNSMLTQLLSLTKGQVHFFEMPHIVG